MSRGFQRGFASGERLRVIDKPSCEWFEAGTADVFVTADFNTWMGPNGPNDALEDEWKRLETSHLGAVRRVGTNEEGPSDRDSVKVVAALHFARSFALHESHLRIASETLKDSAARMAADPTVRQLYEKDIGHAPDPGEIEARVADTMARMLEHRGLFLNLMIRAYNFALDRFQDLQVQIMHAPKGMAFVLGDCPLIGADKSAMRLTSKGQIALGDADMYFMPLTAMSTMTLWTGSADRDAILPVYECQRLNTLSWRAATRFVACHPDCDPRRLLAMDQLRRR